MLAVCEDELLITLLPRLALVEVESVAVEADVLVVRARTRDGPAACTGCGQVSEWVHSGYCWPTCT
ncbi:hypothetical protein FHU30_002643 [Actinomadura rupiterrae]|nr:hypothetical protein [Actinomadura rupiterrae]